MAFQHWLKTRDNIAEGWFSKKPTDDTPTDPQQIYNSPKVLKYYNYIVPLLGLQQGNLKIIDRQGQEKGDFNGTIPPQVVQALQRFIAAHIFGHSQERTFLQISPHDATIIIDFLDSLKQSGQGGSLAEELQIANPTALAHWFQTKLPVAQDALYHQGYSQGHEDYVDYRDLRKGRDVSPLRDKDVQRLFNTASRVVQHVSAYRPDQKLTGVRKLKELTRDLSTALQQIRPSGFKSQKPVIGNTQNP